MCVCLHMVFSNDNEKTQSFTSKMPFKFTTMGHKVNNNNNNNISVKIQDFVTTFIVVGQYGQNYINQIDV